MGGLRGKMSVCVVTIRIFLRYHNCDDSFVRLVLLKIPFIFYSMPACVTCLLFCLYEGNMLSWVLLGRRFL